MTPTNDSQYLATSLVENEPLDDAISDSYTISGSETTHSRMQIPDNAPSTSFKQSFYVTINSADFNYRKLTKGFI